MPVIAAAMAGIASGEAYRPFDPGQLKGPQAGPRNQLLVIGSPHLSAMPPAFRAEQLQPVLDRLAAWHPQAIAIEALSGVQCDLMRRYPDRYRDSVETYCWDPAIAARATGLDVPAATAAWGKRLAAWPATPAPADRRRLAALFLAGGEGASALVQWLRLPPAERRAGDGLDASLVARLDALATNHDESLLIAAALAARLGLERVHAMDDHTADAPEPDQQAFGAAVSKAWDNPATARRKATDAALQANLGRPDAMLALYRANNEPDQPRLTFDSDFGAAMEEPSPQRFGRRYLGWWETRNLRMAANIRDMFADRPGIRGLVIVGASHKGYLEAYLDRMHDMEVVDAAAVLR